MPFYLWGTRQMWVGFIKLLTELMTEETAQRLVSLVTIFQQTHPTTTTTTTTSFHCQPLTEGTLAPGCFCDGLLTGLLFIQRRWEAVQYIYALIFTHHMCWRWMEWLQACWRMRSLQGRHTVSALMIGCSSVQKKKKISRPGGHCPWPHDLRVSLCAFSCLESQWSVSCCQSTHCNDTRPYINGKEN